jgi:hypothetical protein
MYNLGYKAVLNHERLLDNSLCAVAVGPPLTLSPPVITFSPPVMSCRFSLLMASPACFCACAVGPPLTGSACPVKSFSASVMCEMVSESSLPVDLPWKQSALILGEAIPHDIPVSGMTAGKFLPT